ncbi:alpha/beta hydrolase-fold protein [Bifidobacterium thermophilum]|uniref:alpha/beta hydrolase-fold protein n=1 Tax=Bifidobacterium thermophilum TaxID=33905 RepID=UPI0030A462A1
MRFLTNIHLLNGWFPPTLFTLTALSALLMVMLPPSVTHRGQPRRRVPALLRELLAGLVGFGAGGLVIWLLSDVFLVFGVSLGWMVMLAIAVAIGLIAFAVAAAVHSRGARRAIACIMAVLSLLSGALRVDMVYGEYTTIGSLFGMAAFPDMSQAQISGKATMTIEQWQRLADRKQLPSMPETGEIRTVDIPATASHFKARNADVYLPPAALSSRPPALPVMVMLAGQPGSPDRFFNASGIATTLNAYAAKHHGLAPIVVSPDQNGAATQNSLCSDTPVYGKAETYLTVDVTKWIRKTLPVSTSPNDWLIGGFSQGGTCSTQLGPAHPTIYGHIFAAAGELEPTDHNRETTVNRYFGGNAKLYQQHVPATIIKRHAPSAQTLFSIAGEWDTKSQRNAAIIAKAAKQAGMTVHLATAKGSGHDWHTVNTGLAAVIDRFCAQSGIGADHRKLSTYPNLVMLKVSG